MPFYPTRPQSPSVAEESLGFTQLLSKPEVQAALLQFGISMMSPQFGSPMTRIGTAAGEAAAAAGRASTLSQERKRREETDKQEAEDRAFRRQTAQERLDIAKGHLEERRKRPSGGRSLQSLFTKPKSFQQFKFDMAKVIAENAILTGDERSIDQIMADPQFHQRVLNEWQRSTNVGGGTSAGTETTTPTADHASLIAKAKAAIANGKDPDAVMQRLLELGVTADEIPEDF